ncbi:MAG: precorrin-6Y C5,15-methyltransferase (decarboxylating) subunit CbiT [Armatimonadota bacterium]
MGEFYPPGIPDEEFIRDEVPMTKAEVRAITMSKARLKAGLRVLDIGAGTGSFTVEAGLLCPGGEVVAVECNPEALALTRKNIAHFHVTNVTIIEGEAPEALAGLAPFDRIFLGGTGGKMTEILEALPDFLVPGGWVVSNTIGLESTTEVLNRLRQTPWTAWEIAQVSIARGVPIGPRLIRFDPLNPIWIAVAQLEKR